MKYIGENAIKKLIALIKGDLAKKQNSITVSGLLKGNGTTISAAVAEIDYMAPPTGGTTGQALLWTADGTAEWGTVTTTDQFVKNSLNTAVKAYITGTTNSATNTGEQVFDTGVYLTTNAGELQAKTFIGDLTGTATKATTADACTGNALTATTADKTKASITISLNGNDQGAFDGSHTKHIDITPTNIGAPTISQFESATSQATDTEVTAMLDGVFS